MRKPRILTVGTVYTDFVCTAKKLPEPGERVVSDGEYFFAPGGSGTFFSVCAARLGGDVVFCGCTGDDGYADDLFAAFEKESIDRRFIFRDSDEKTGFSHIFCEENAPNRVTLFPGANQSLNEEHIEEAFTCYPDALLMNGESDTALVRYALSMADAQDIPAFLDLVGAKVLPEGCSCRVLLSDEPRTEYLTGIRPSTAADALRAAIALTGLIRAEYVVIRLERRGAFVYDGLHHEILSAPETRTVDPTGTAEAFCASLALRFIQNGENIADAVRYANCVSAYTGTQNGAYAAFPAAAQLEDFIRHFIRR